MKRRDLVQPNSQIGCAVYDEKLVYNGMMSVGTLGIILAMEWMENDRYHTTDYVKVLTVTGLIGYVCRAGLKVVP